MVTSQRVGAVQKDSHWNPLLTDQFLIKKGNQLNRFSRLLPITWSGTMGESSVSGSPPLQWDVWRSSQGRGRTSASHSGLSLTTNIPRARLVIIFRWIITKSQLRFETPDKSLRTLPKVPRNLQLFCIFRQKIDRQHGNYQVCSLSAAISAILHSITFRHCLEL